MNRIFRPILPAMILWVIAFSFTCQYDSPSEQDAYDAAGKDNLPSDDDDDDNDDTEAPGAVFEETDLFISGQEGYNVFRIPSIIETASGALLAFCEGRQSISDAGDIDIVMKKSADQGRTWSPLFRVIDNGSDTAGNQTPILDRATGQILLPFCTNPAADPMDRRVFITRSDDEGESWSIPLEITDMVKRDEWNWYATGPGRGIQLESGRFIVPCDHRNAITGQAHSHVIYSDDGETWQIGGILGPDTDESQVAQLDDGSLVINMRDLSPANRRWVARSFDEGQTWTASYQDDALPDPSCMGSLLQTPYGLVFSNPASEVYLLRKRLTVRLSLNGGQTWAYSRVLHPGGAAYSALSVLLDGEMGLLFENGPLPFLPYARITFARFSLGWLKGQ